MRITVDISEDNLKSILALTGEKKKSAAVSKAVNDFVRRARNKEFGRRLMEGEFADAFDWEYLEKQKQMEQALIRNANEDGGAAGKKD